MSSSLLITKTIKEISVLINEIQDNKRKIYSSNQPNIVQQTMKTIKNKLSEIEDKVNKHIYLLYYNIQFGLIEEEINNSSGNTRNEYKGMINSQKIEFNKTKEEIKTLDNKIKLNLIGNNSKYTYKEVERDNNLLRDKIENNTNKIIDTTKTANEIIDRDKIITSELKKQGNQLLDIHLKMGETEENLSLVQQLRQVMQNNDLFYRLKLYGMAILLFIANIIILFVKFR